MAAALVPTTWQGVAACPYCTSTVEQCMKVITGQLVVCPFGYMCAVQGGRILGCSGAHDGGSPGGHCPETPRESSDSSEGVCVCTCSEGVCVRVCVHAYVCLCMYQCVHVCVCGSECSALCRSISPSPSSLSSLSWPAHPSPLSSLHLILPSSLAVLPQ